MSTRDDHPYVIPTSAPLRRREVTGRGMADEFLQRVSAELGRRIAAYDLVDLHTTDNLAEEFALRAAGCADGSVPCVRTVVAADGLPGLAQRLLGGDQSDPERPVILFRRGSDCCGAIVATFEAVLTRAAALMEPEDGRLFVGTKDMSDGLRLRSSAGGFDLLLWGENWLPLVGA